MEDIYKERIGYKGDLDDISKIICKDFDIGDFVVNKIITSGYEDFNLIIETGKGKYLAKIFADFRNLNDCERYVNIMLEALKKGINLPRLYKSNQGYLHIIETRDYKVRLCVMDFIDGKDVFSTKYDLNEEDIRFIANQASLINSIDLKPEFEYDSWAIVNCLSEFEKTKNYLEKKDLKLIEPLIEKFRAVNLKELPYCFVHGDIITTNVIRDNKGFLWIIDFAVANYYPRIQELAVLACNLFFDKKSKEKSEKNLKLALEEYQKKINLLDKELEILPLYINLAHAMHVIGATREEKVNNNKLEENRYWLSQGRAGLKQRLSS